MTKLTRTITLLALSLSLLTTSLGCSTGFITAAARDNAASFVTDVFSTAVSASLGSN